MTAETHSFRRLVLGLQPSAPDRAMRLAVELADLLRIELLGVVLQDTSLNNLAGLPFAREFRPLAGGWQTLDLDRLSSELEIAARSSERNFTAVTRHVAPRCQFEVIRGPTAGTIRAIVQAGDIVMIIEPANPADRATQQFSWLMEAAFQSTAAVVIVPREVRRTSGSIVAISTGPEDPSIDIAGAIALAAKEKLIVAAVPGPGHGHVRIDKLTEHAGLSVKYISIGNRPMSDSTLMALFLCPLDERLIVLTRGVVPNDIAVSLASARQIPVLIVEPFAHGASN